MFRRLAIVLAGMLPVAATGCGGGSGSSLTPVASAPGANLPTAVAKHKKRTLALPSELVPCPEDAVFLRMPGEIRGYPLSASGSSVPCADILGPQTLLTGNGNGYGAIAVSVNGYLHTLAFQSNGYGGLLIYFPDAAGDAAPSRSVLVDQDHVALAIDSDVNDYVVASQAYSSDNCWYVVPSGAVQSSTSNCDPAVSAIFALATTPQKELVVLGTDAVTNATRVDVFANAASTASSLVRSIVGLATGLPTASGPVFGLNLSIATDPVTGAIYVFSSNPNAGIAPKVSVFDAAARGNVAPLRTLSGVNTLLPKTSFAINVLAIDAASNLYVNSTDVASQNVLISIFAPTATGDASPTRTIEDDTLVNPSSGGIAVRR
jgi:hypothetical protein